MRNQSVARYLLPCTPVCFLYFFNSGHMPTFIFQSCYAISHTNFLFGTLDCTLVVGYAALFFLATYLAFLSVLPACDVPLIFSYLIGLCSVFHRYVFITGMSLLSCVCLYLALTSRSCHLQGIVQRLLLWRFWLCLRPLLFHAFLALLFFLSAPCMLLLGLSWTVVLLPRFKIFVCIDFAMRHRFLQGQELCTLRNLKTKCNGLANICSGCRHWQYMGPDLSLASPKG